MAGVDGISIAIHKLRGVPYLIYKGTLAPSMPVPCISLLMNNCFFLSFIPTGRSLFYHTRLHFKLMVLQQVIQEAHTNHLVHTW